uniref:Cytochrome c oxidase subunit 3 n=1 Tax=Doliolum nationalis TaxID=76841 RepID=Q5KT48_DOLNA|nr:cytochrome oxidase subunit III [Doliolum nationalis]
MARSTPFHLVDASPWPILSAMSGFLLLSSLCDFMHSSSYVGILVGAISTIIVTGFWWRDVSREACLGGFHNPPVQISLRMAMIWFICSEVLFFFGFFWTFFHASLGVVAETGYAWPPAGVLVLDPSSVPLLNTVLLLGSSITVTWSHNCLLMGNYMGAKNGLVFTIALGAVFTAVQYLEYCESGFSISDSAYGSVFFMATGFHGFHVLVGSAFLVVCLVRMVGGQLNASRHVGYECAVWYWHFVDTVWIYLYCLVYWWGSGFLG